MSKNYFPSHNLYQINETTKEQLHNESSQADNTLIKYFFTEDKPTESNPKPRPDQNTNSKRFPSNPSPLIPDNKQITPEQIDRLFRKPIKLKNAIKERECFWDREGVSFSTQV